MATKTTKKTTAKISAKKTSSVKAEKKTTAPKAPPIAPLPNDEKLKIIAEFATKDGDTGSPEVQIALLTKRIEKLVAHLKANPGDNHSRRGLLGMVSKRRRLINYLAKKDSKRAKEISLKLNLI